MQVALLEPNKTETVPFIDGHSNAPRRYARATVQHGATNSSEVYWQEYMVGPLPATNATAVQPLTFPFQNTHPGITTMHKLYSLNEGTNFLVKFGTDHDDIAQRLFNTVSDSL